LDYETRLYHAPGARPTADVDLLVPAEHRRAAFAVLDRLGFEPRAAAPGFDNADYHEVAWTRTDAEIDLHLALAPLVRCRIDYRAIWREAEPHQLGASETRVLARPHAAIFQALHMAIDHFDVPAIYLIDLMRLLPSAAEAARAREIARAWHLRRPLATALALAAAFVPPSFAGPMSPPSPLARRVIAGYGPLGRLPRREQLLRKFLHFDTFGEGLRYLVVQSRRGVGELFEQRVRRRSARERLNLAGTRSSEKAVEVRD
ncbi:MAG TPA: nucleotidyltransferase family protein, partial [Polyangia bacterium]|nr:nucleotidyltransferase family protein [Polyangia bacterium]